MRGPMYEISALRQQLSMLKQRNNKLDDEKAALMAIIEELIDPAWTTSFNSDWNTTDCIWCGAIRRITGWEGIGVENPIWEEIGHREDCPVAKANRMNKP